MAVLNDKTLSLRPGARVELYDIDLTDFGGSVFRFTPHREDATPAEVYSITDANGVVRGGLGTQLPDIAQDDTLQVELLVRTASMVGTTPRTRVSFIESLTTGSVTDRTASILFGADGTNVFFDDGDGDMSFVAGSATTAGEFTFVTLKVRVDYDGDVFLRIQPSGYDASDTGIAHVAGLKVFKISDGIRSPVHLERDLTQWTATSTTVAVTSNTSQAVKVPIHDGNAYTPLPIEITGFEKTGVGPFPKPIARMANATGAGSQLFQQYGDIRGATVTRTRMYADQLDNGIDPDPLAHYTPDVFTVLRKSLENSQVVEFELGSILDQEGVTLPRRRVNRDICPWKYRTWNGSSFDYPDAENGCPYTGSNYFDADGNAVVDPEDDVCSRKLTTGCRKRFGASETLPLGSFPMVGRQRF